MSDPIPVIAKDDLADLGDTQIRWHASPVEVYWMSGIFQLLTSFGLVTCVDCWIAVDSEGNPYPIDPDMMDKYFVDTPTLVASNAFTKFNRGTRMGTDWQTGQETSVDVMHATLEAATAAVRQLTIENQQLTADRDMARQQLERLQAGETPRLV